MSLTDPRKLLGHAVTEVAEHDERIVVLSTDSGNSSGFGAFAQEHPDRYIELGIMEQAATGIAAGLATTGLVPVLCAIAPFVTSRNFEMFRNDLGYMRQNVKIVGRNGGMSYADLGPTHYSLEDFSIIRMIPGVVVIAPQDPGEIRAAAHAMLNHEGPVYLRIGAQQIPDLFTTDDFTIGRGRLISSGNDVTVISTGTATANTMRACETLREEGISMEHLGMPTIQPLDEHLILESVRRTGRVVTVEEHYVTGGLFGAVSELLAEHCPTRALALGVDLDYVHGGPYPALLEEHGLTTEAIAQTIAAWARDTRH